MKTATFHYDEAIPALLNQSCATFERDARLAMGVKLYELGRLTSGQAAKLAGISRVDFLLACRDFGSASVMWDDEELAREATNLKDSVTPRPSP